MISKGAAGLHFNVFFKPHRHAMADSLRRQAEGIKQKANSSVCNKIQCSCVEWLSVQGCREGLKGGGGGWVAFQYLFLQRIIETGAPA